MSIKLEAGTLVSNVLTTELNSLANNAACALSAAYDPGTDLHIWVIPELVVTFGTNPTADSPVEIYIVPAIDGTNYADYNTTGPVVNSSHFAGVFQLKAVTTAQRLTTPPTRPIRLPPCKMKFGLLQRSGQTMAASGNILNLLPFRLQ